MATKKAVMKKAPAAKPLPKKAPNTFERGALAVNEALRKKLAEAEHRLALARPQDTEALATAQKEVEDLKAEVVALQAKAAEASPEGLDLNTASALLMELPEGSGIRNAIQGFLKALTDDRAAGGAVGAAALAVLDAACDSTDPAYANVTVAQRAMGVSFANALKAAF